MAVYLFKKLQEADSSVSLLAWTLVGVALQVTLTIASMLTIVANVGFPIPFPLANYPYLGQTNLWIIIGLYVVLPVLYCIPVSLWAFKPKRTVSALNIQLLTIVLFGIILLTKEVISFSGPNANFDYIRFAETFGIIWLFSIMLYGIVGFVQTLFIRWWIGLNREDLDVKTYSVALDFKKVRELLDDPSFLNVRKLTKKFDESDFMLMKSQSVVNGIVIAAGPDRSKKGHCILATVPFNQSLYAVSRSASSSNLRTSIVDEIKGRLGNGIKFEDTQYDVVVTNRAESYAFEPTKTRFEVTRDIWYRIPLYFRYAFICTILAFILVSFLYFDQTGLGLKMEIGTYAELLEILFVASVIELGGTAWEELSRRGVAKPSKV